MKKSSILISICVMLFSINTINSQELVPAPPGMEQQESRTTVWNGTWSKGFPNKEKTAIIKADLIITNYLEAKELIIDNGFSIIIKNGALVKVNNLLDEDIKQKITLEDGGSFYYKENGVQDNNSILGGENITRTTFHVKQYASMFISSPVSGQDIGSTHPSSAYNQHQYNSSTSSWQFIPPSHIMVPGRGYVETVVGNGVFGNPIEVLFPPLPAGQYNQTFTGIANSGTIQTPIIGNAPNLIGNPYDDFLDADAFLMDTANANVIGGPILLWTRNTEASTGVPGTQTFNFTANDYSTYNLLGGVSAGRNITLDANPSNLNQNIYAIPNGKIRMGTAFFIRGLNNGNITFTEDMRTSDDGGSEQQFRSAENQNTILSAPERHRIWINLVEGDGTNPNAPFRQTLIGYAGCTTTTSECPTNGSNDRLFDAQRNSNTNPAFEVLSLAPSSTEQLIIQGRNVANFNINDQFQLYLRENTNNQITDFTFTAEQDGMFDTQPYFIWDNGTIYPLPHQVTINFATDATRFRIVFKSLLTKVVDSQCGSTLQNITNSIYADIVAGANRYRWEITKEGVSPMVFETVGRTLSLLNSSFIGFTTFDTEYTIRVAARVNGVWQPYWISCVVKTPPYPTTQVQGQFCNIQIGDSDDIIQAIKVTNLSIPAGHNNRYKFRLRNLDGTFLDDYENPHGFSRCQLRSSSFVGIQANTTYLIDVCYGINGEFGPYGPECEITTPATIEFRQSETNFEIKVKSIPNPYAEDFTIELKTDSEETILVSVYDMFGRNIDYKEINFNELNKFKFGSSYPAGIYNVIVTQGRMRESLKVIKK